MPSLSLIYTTRRMALLIAGIASIAFVACASSDTKEVASTAPSQPSVDQSDRTGRESSFTSVEPSWTVISDKIYLELATPDLGVGIQRFGVVLSDDTGLLKFPVVKFTANHFPNGYESEPNIEISTNALGRFYEFPFGTRGIHSTDIEFGRSGLWSVFADIPRPDGSSAHVEVRFPVAEKAHSVTVGQTAPASQNHTLSSEGDIAKLTTGSLRDPDLYEFSIAEALKRDRPLLIVFASPAFCTNAVCGPQVEVASELRVTYGEQVDFIHIDLYTNPHEIQGDLSKAQLTPILEEWGLSSQEWTFIVDSYGTVTHRFENFAPKPELIMALDQVVANG